MLQTIREHTQGWIAGVIIGIIILTFALWGIHSYFVGNAGSNIVAEVNGVEISKEQLAVAYERLRRKAQAQFGANHPLNVRDDTSLKERALNSLIEIEALKQASIAQGYWISDAQIDNYLQSVPEFQVNGQFSLERFQEILASTLLSTGEFLDIIKTSLLIDQPKLGIIFSSFALPDENDYVIELVNQERDVNYINIPLQQFLSQPMTIPPEKIQAYYDAHKNEFMTPEQVNVEYIELSLKDLSAKITPTETMLKSFYNENINSYTQPMEWKLASTLVPVKNHASQDDWKQAYQKANDIVSAANKGDGFPASTDNRLEQGWMMLNQVPAELQRTVGELTKAGEISDPVKTNDGYVVVKVVDIKEPKIQLFEAVQAKVKDAYVHQHAEEKFMELRDRLADATYEHPDSLQFASKTLSLPIKTSDLFTKEKAGKDISQYKKVRDTAFSNDVLNLQNNSDVIQLNPETMIVLRVKSHIASTLLPLKSISKQIEGKLKAEEAELQAEKFANDLNAKLNAGADPQKIASNNRLQWTKLGFIGRYATKVDSAILDLAFRSPNPATAPSKVVYGVTRLPSGYAIVAVKAVKKGEVTDKKQYYVFAEQVQNSQGLLEYELYKRSQLSKDNAKIQIFQ